MATKGQIEVQLADARNELSAADRRLALTTERLAQAEGRLKMALAVIRNSKSNLEHLFGPLTDKGPDDTDQYLQYMAEDGLAVVLLDPHTGKLVICDPQGKVDSVSVDFDERGRLDPDERTAIRRFRAEVMLTRSPDYIGDTGPISLAQRSVSGPVVSSPGSNSADTVVISAIAAS